MKQTEQAEALTTAEKTLIKAIRETGWGEIDKIKFQNGEPTVFELRKVIKIK
jgi:hypothetical protein